ARPTTRRLPSFPTRRSSDLVRDLAETHVVLDRVDQDRHDVALLAARVGQLLEAALDLRAVARGLEAADALDLLALDGRVDLQERSEEHTSELQSRFDLVCRL